MAISNNRILSVEHGQVTFSYRDRKDKDRLKTKTLDAQEFIRRFLLHVLPNGFMRIRHFGFLANRAKKHALPQCRKLLGLNPALPEIPKKSPQGSKKGTFYFFLLNDFQCGRTGNMPRTARASVGGMCYHVVNRGNARQEVFRKSGDYKAFIELFDRACKRVPMRVLGYCVMPNHFHLLLWSYSDGDLGKWMQWLLTAHVRRYHQHYKTNGHVWQGRFKAFPIEQDDHLLIVLRYIERNPLRAGLVERAEDWPWSSLSRSTMVQDGGVLHPLPVSRPKDWIGWVNQPQTEAELEGLRHSVNRGTPYGSVDWVQYIAAQLGLEASLRPRGRPRKQ